MAKAGLDGHDRGVKLIARIFRDAGFEVIYTGLHQSPVQIVKTSIQEDVDVVALSVLSSAHMSICRNVIEELRKADAMDKILILGGTVLAEDIPKLKEMGVAEVFATGSPIDAGAKYVKRLFEDRKA
jgi:methylmalonyl-CoA mutase C-terminal domain/subunit